MPRPRKKVNQRKDDDLRIPMTASQKQLIKTAAEVLSLDMAAWARPLLLRAAEDVLAKRGDRGSNQKIECPARSVGMIRAIAAAIDGPAILAEPAN
jgi:hypothetical protein